MTLRQQVELPDSHPVEAAARWEYSRGTPGTLSDSRGWELIEWWVPGRPHLTHAEREYVRKQLTPPTTSP